MPKGETIKKHAWKVLSLICLPLAAYLLMAASAYLAGGLVWTLGVAALLGTDRRLAKHVALLFGAVIVMTIAPISTNTDLASTTGLLEWGGMTLGAILTVGAPYLIMRRVYKENDVIRLERPHHAHWNWHRVGYVAFAAVLCYFAMPPWMDATGHLASWDSGSNVVEALSLLLGLMLFGAWEELFLVITTLAILRQHMPFWTANVIQSVIWTIILHEVGFQGWIAVVVFLFSMLQGYTYKRTCNLGYVLAIHLAIDVVLWMALVNAQHPEVLNIFVTRMW